MHMIDWRNVAPASACAHVAATVLGPRDRVVRHSHRGFAEVFWVLEGTGRHLLGERWQEIRERDLVFIREDDVHACRVRPGNRIAFVNVAFPANVLHELQERYGERLAQPWRTPRSQPHRLAEMDLLMLQRDAKRLARNAESRICLDQLLLTLATLDHDQPDLPPECPDWLAQAIVAIREPRHFTGGSQALAELCHRSPEHVCRAVRRYLGKTPSMIVNDARADHAAQMLRTSHVDITSLAIDCGCTSLSHFYRIFRARHGVTPREYRLNARNTLPTRGSG